MTTHVPNADSLHVRWVTSSYSGGGNNCVQAAALGSGQLAVRDSKAPSGPALLIPALGWAGFLSGLRRGELGAG